MLSCVWACYQGGSHDLLTSLIILSKLMFCLMSASVDQTGEVHDLKSNRSRIGLMLRPDGTAVDDKELVMC
jgi:hypothetical protein